MTIEAILVDGAGDRHPMKMLVDGSFWFASSIALPGPLKVQLLYDDVVIKEKSAGHNDLKANEPVRVWPTFQKEVRQVAEYERLKAELRARLACEPLRAILEYADADADACTCEQCQRIDVKGACVNGVCRERGE